MISRARLEYFNQDVRESKRVREKYRQREIKIIIFPTLLSLMCIRQVTSDILSDNKHKYIITKQSVDIFQFNNAVLSFRVHVYKCFYISV